MTNTRKKKEGGKGQYAELCARAALAAFFICATIHFLRGRDVKLSPRTLYSFLPKCQFLKIFRRYRLREVVSLNHLATVSLKEFKLIAVLYTFGDNHEL